MSRLRINWSRRTQPTQSNNSIFETISTFLCLGAFFENVVFLACPWNNGGRSNWAAAAAETNFNQDWLEQTVPHWSISFSIARKKRRSGCNYSLSEPTFLAEMWLENEGKQNLEFFLDISSSIMLFIPYKADKNRKRSL